MVGEGWVRRSPAGWGKHLLGVIRDEENVLKLDCSVGDITVNLPKNTELIKIDYYMYVNLLPIL